MGVESTARKENYLRREWHRAGIVRHQPPHNKTLHPDRLRSVRSSVRLRRVRLRVSPSTRNPRNSRVFRVSLGDLSAFPWGDGSNFWGDGGTFGGDDANFGGRVGNSGRNDANFGSRGANFWGNGANSGGDASPPGSHGVSPEFLWRARGFSAKIISFLETPDG